MVLSENDAILAPDVDERVIASRRFASPQKIDR
jgi:hypothetical protein